MTRTQVQNLHAESYIVRTRSGEEVSLTDPDPADITLMDVAAGLSLARRWEVGEHYSVATHAVWVSLVLAGSGPAAQLAGLLSHAYEAYLAPENWSRRRMVATESPLLRGLQRRVGVAIAQSLTGSSSYGRGFGELIASAHRAVTATEHRDLLTRGDGPHPGALPLAILPEPIEIACGRFLRTFRILRDAAVANGRHPTSRGPAC